MKFLKYFAFLTVVVVMLSSCTASRRSGGGNKLKAERERYEAVVSQAFDFNQLQSKVKMGFKGKSLSGKMSIEHGKRFAMGVTVLGIEVARVEANNDSVMIIDKFDKAYSVIPMSQLANGHEDEIRLDALECLMLGRIFVPGKGEAKNSDFGRFVWTRSSAADDADVQGTFTGANYQLIYTIDAASRLKSTTLAFTDAKGYSATWTYSGHTTVEKGLMPGHETISAKGGKQLEAEMNINSTTVSKNAWKSFSPSGAYKRVTPQELISMIKNLKN